MSGDGIGTIAAYEPGGGYQPPDGGLSLRRFLGGVLGVALFLAVKWLLETYLGNKTAEDVFQLIVCAGTMPWIVRAILRPEPIDHECTAEEQRRAYVRSTAWLIGWLIAVTALATLAIQSLVFAG